MIPLVEDRHQPAGHLLQLRARALPLILLALTWLGGPPAWADYVGCFTDTETRALPVVLASSGSTVESCVAAASQAGQAYAGLQYYGWCFGGNALGHAQVANAECNTPCTANPAQMCGGVWRNSIYTTNAPLAASYVSTPPGAWIAARTQTYTIKVTNAGSSVWNAGGANPVRLGVHFGTADDGWGGWATDQRFWLPADVPAGGSATFNVAITAPASNGSYVLRHRMVKEDVAWFAQIQKTNVTVATARYLGCYTDESQRALPVWIGTSAYTPARCVQEAAARGLAYAGVQAYGYCFGGQTPGYTRVAEAECNTPCSADASQSCGGMSRNGIWSTAAASWPPQFGVTSVDGRYRFEPGKNLLTESADRIVELGARAAFFYLDGVNCGYPDGTAAGQAWPANWWTRRPDASTPPKPVCDLVNPAAPPTLAQVAAHPVMDAALARAELQLILLTAYVPGAGILAPDEAREEQQYRDLTYYLMTRFQGTGKRFVLKNWEGDWHLLINYDTVPDAQVGRALQMIRWWRAKQRGVERGRADAVRTLGANADVHVYHAVEVNRVQDALAGKLRAANLLPFIGADMVTYSAWDSMADGGSNQASVEARLNSAADLLLDRNAQLQTPLTRFAASFGTLPTFPADPLGLGAGRLVLSEFGLDEKARPGEVDYRLKATLAVARQRGLGGATYWELYTNEPKEFTPIPANDVGMWLYQRDGSRSLALATLQANAGWTPRQVAAPTNLHTEPAVFTLGGSGNNLVWNRPAGGLRFELEITGPDGVRSPATVNAWYTLGSSLPAGSYQWRVRARGATDSAWATGPTFQIVDPAAPALAASYASQPATSWTTGQTRTYTVQVTNSGSSTWSAGGANPVRLGVHFGTADDGVGVGWATDQRFWLSADVPPGGSTNVSVPVTAPSAAGSYVLRHRMVKEGLAWFAQIQKTPVTVAAATGCTATRPACYSQSVLIGEDPDLNREFNDFAAIYLDALGTETTGCRAAAADKLNRKVAATLDAGGDYRGWLEGDSVGHAFAAALELQYHGTPADDAVMRRMRDSFEDITVQESGCDTYTNGCMDDFTLTASGFAWMAAYEAKQGRWATADDYTQRSKALLAKVFAPMKSSTGSPKSGSICYFDPTLPVALACGGSSSGVGSSTRIIGVGHVQENPAYGFGLMTGVASACAGLFVAGSPCDFGTVDPATGLTWRDIASELARHARSKTAQGSQPLTFQAAGPTTGCLDFHSWPPTGRVDCGDPSYGYVPEHFPLKRFYGAKVGYDFSDFGSDFKFDRWDPDYACRSAQKMYSRDAFYGLNRYVVYNLLGNQIWPGGSLNAHVNALASCGNGTCSGGETTANCPRDCAPRSYLGCYTDAETRALPQVLGEGDHTVESCVRAASDAGYRYAGLQWYGQCFAGNTLGYTLVGEAECNTPCSANPSQMCGGAYRNSVYTGYVGCYTDQPNRALPFHLPGSGYTVASCLQAAAAGGYRYAGLQWYGECFAGDSLGYSPAPDAECNTACTANPSEACGGAYRNSIWKVSVP